MTATPAELRSRFIDAVATDGWGWQTIESGSPLRGTLTAPSGEEVEVNAYLRNVTHGGGDARPDEEFRIQISNVPALIHDSVGSRRVLLGWAEDLGVYVAFDASRHTKPGNSPSSIQVALATLQRARVFGFASQSRGGGDVVCAFHPERLAAYVFAVGSTHEHEPTPGGDATTSAAEAASEAAVRPSRTSGQGLQADHAARRAVELHAMHVATAYYEDEGWTVNDVSAVAPYDLLCHRSGQERRVEVKGTTGAGERVLLTANEVEHAQLNPSLVSLVVVSGIELAWQPEVTASGGLRRVFDPWELDHEGLRTVTYSYEVPD